MAIVKRLDKGATLTYAELDGNFDHLVAEDTAVRAEFAAVDTAIRGEFAAADAAHAALTDNPHSVTATQVGLGNVDNTADLDKPVSTATLAAIDNHVNDTAGAHADSAITFTPAGTGAVATTVQAKLRESVSVKDFGAVGDWNGSTGTNDAAAFQAAIDYLSTQGGELYIPPGKYYIATALTPKSKISVRGASVGTELYLGENHLFNNTADLTQNTVFQDFYVYGTTSSGDVFRVTNGNLNNAYFLRVYAFGVNSFLYTAGTGTYLTHVIVEQCQFSYNNNWHVDLLNGTAINSVQFLNTRFEQNNPTFGGYRAVGNAIATGNLEFINCVFEGMDSLYAVNLGNNIYGASFTGCHFELNCVNTVYDAGADIYIGSGKGTVIIDNCNFAPPGSTATNFHNIRIASGSHTVRITNNIVNGTRIDGYTGFIYCGNNSCSSGVVLSGNVINQTPASATFNPYVNARLAVVLTPEYLTATKLFNLGGTVGPSIKVLTTTDNTGTVMWGGEYLPMGAATVNSILITAEVNCVDTANTVYGSWVLRRLITTSDAYDATIRGNMDETPVTTGGSLACDLILINDTVDSLGVGLKVTGVADTTIKWLASVKMQVISH